jgi:cytochrome c oxidase subunit 1
MSPLDRLLASRSQRVGLAHLVLVLAALAVGTFYALVLFVSGAHEHLAALRGHGVVMTLLVLVPAIPSVLGNLVLPRIASAEELAFPRLGGLVVALQALGLVTFVIAAQTDGLGVGTELVMAQSGSLVSNGASWTLATLALSSAAAALQAVRVMATALASRDRTQPFVAGLAASSALSSIGAPLALGLATMAWLDRTAGLGLFDPALGGDAALFSALLGVATNMLLTSTVIAGLGVVTHVIERHAGATAHWAVAASLWGLALTGALGGAQQLVSLDVGSSASLRMGFFDMLHHALLLAVVLRSVWALRGGAEAGTPSLQFALGAVAMLAIALPSGLALALPSLGEYLQGSSFATGRLHYLAVGGVLLALLAGLYEIWPSLVGVAIRRDRASLALGALVLGIQLAFLPMLWLGAHGVPRPLPALPLAWSTVSLVGLAVIVVGLLAAASSLVSPLRDDEHATA